MIWNILVLAFLNRLININQSLWLDEAAQALMSQQSLYSIIFERSGDFHPPLSYILYHFWMMVNQSEIWLRLLPILFGIATVFIVYKISQKLFSQKIALISALLLAMAPYHVYYSQEIRMYSMAAFFASLSMYFFIYSKPGGLILASTALVYTHYMGVFLILAQAIYFLTTNRREFLRYLKIPAGILVLYLPWISQFYQQLISGTKADQILPGWGSLLSLEPTKAIPLAFLKFSIGRIDFENTYVYGAIAIIVLGFYSMLFYKAFKGKEIKLIWFWFIIPIISAWLISFILPMNQPFRLLFILPAFYILLALGITKLGRFWRIGLFGVLSVSMMGLLIYWTNPRFHREDWRSVSKDLPINTVFAWPIPFDPYIWYGGKGVGVVEKFPATTESVNNNMESLNNPPEVYLFEYLQSLSDPNKHIQKWLGDNGYTIEKTLNYNGVGFIYKYTR